MEYALREDIVPLERIVIQASEFDLFDPRHYIGTTFKTVSGSTYTVQRRGNQCVISGKKEETGEYIPAEGAEIKYLAGLPPVAVASVIIDTRSPGAISYLPDFTALERTLRPHRKEARRGLHLMVYCELQGTPHLIVTSPLKEPG